MGVFYRENKITEINYTLELKGRDKDMVYKNEWSHQLYLCLHGNTGIKPIKTENILRQEM